ncbi:MAG: hypothetical protein WC699_10215 [Bacteroidales bacterium]|jgi:hypothetical protein
MKHYFLLLVLVLAGISSCKPHADVAMGQRRKPVSPEIVFATFTISKVAGQSSVIKLIDYELVPGTIKDPPNTGFMHPVDISLLDIGEKVISAFRIEHPLIENLEYADEQGQLARMIRTIDSARIYLRFKYLPTLEAIRFHSDDPNAPPINSIIKLTK